MKICILLFIFFVFVGNCFSQHLNNDAVRLSKLPPEGILLDKGWKLNCWGDRTNNAGFWLKFRERMKDEIQMLQN